MSTKEYNADRQREWLKKNPERAAEYKYRQREKSPTAKKRIISIDHLANEILKQDRG